MLPVGIVILAAGASTRLGSPKQLLRYGEGSLLRHTVDMALASTAHPVVVVLGANADRLRNELAGLQVVVVDNLEWAEGMGSSIRVGLAALQSRHPEAEAVLFLVCDQPLVTTALLDRIIAVYRESAAQAVASEYGGVTGVPALFSRALFSELAGQHSREGARKILARHSSEVISVPFPQGEIDIDTEGDYQRLLESLEPT